jgi:hypothetical protein
MPDDTLCVKRNPQVAWRELDGQVMLVTPADAVLHLLNDVGSFLWKQIDAPRTAAELADAVFAEYQVDQETARRDVAEFLGEILGRQMLERC